jgi:glycosyltransferase involved in cell wall biosynthesis
MSQAKVRSQDFMSPHPDLVSVVIPAYNAERFLAEAVASVKAQSYRPIEIVIVDDGSRDGTATLIGRLAADSDADLPIRGLAQANAGPSAARNAGIAAAQGEYLAFLDADDRLHPQKIAEQVKHLKQDPGIGMVTAGWRIVTETGRATKRTGGAPEGLLEFETLLFRNEIGTPSAVLVRTGLLRALGGFPRDLRYCEDLELWLRIALHPQGKIWNIGHPLFDRREREGQATRNWAPIRDGWLEVLGRMHKQAPGRVQPIAAHATALHDRYVAFLAYEAGDYKASRRLAAGAWRAAPLALLGSRHAYMTSLAALTTLLPSPLHKAVAAQMRRWREGP